MATSIARLKTALDALYDEDVANQKLLKLVDAVIEAMPPEQLDAAFPGATAETLTNEQKSAITLAALRQDVRAHVIRNAERKNMLAQQEARQAARQAAQAAAAGL